MSGAKGRLKKKKQEQEKRQPPTTTDKNSSSEIMSPETTTTRQERAVVVCVKGCERVFGYYVCMCTGVLGWNGLEIIGCMPLVLSRIPPQRWR